MGARTRANEYEYSRTHKGNVVEGNVVRKAAPARKAPVRIERKKKANLSRSTLLRRQKARLVMLGCLGAAALIGLCGVLLATLEVNSRLAAAVSDKEKEVKELTVANDAREYEIRGSVDYNVVITTATQQLGMVRASASQVRTYDAGDTQYIQQVARVPED